MYRHFSSLTMSGSQSRQNSNESNAVRPGYVTVRPVTHIGGNSVNQGQSNVVIQSTSYAIPIPLQAVAQPAKSYSIKIIPKKKADYSIKKLRDITKVFDTVDELKMEVCKACEDQISPESFGYFEPGLGHRKCWLTSNADVKEMYSIHKSKSEILLWSNKIVQQRKRAHSPDTDESEKHARYDKYLDKITEVEMIEEELKEKHAGRYSDLQLRSWAHLIQMKHHSSYDIAPNKRFYKTVEKSSDNHTVPTSASATNVTTVSPNVSAVSPGRRVNIRGQCVQQLLQLHELLERGGINQQQYEEMQATIMGDVKKFD